MAAETISKNLIEPSSSTPESLRRHNLSSYDQMMFLTYGSLAFFYVNPPKRSTFYEQLRNSLAKILVHYYPLAGRVVKNEYINCNDQGVELVEIRINCSMYDLMNTRETNVADLIFPRRVVATSEDCLLALQLSHFNCGGVAISICISHKIADGSTILAFMTDWAASTRLSSYVPSPVMLKKLKYMAVEFGIQNPSRTEIVTALLFQCAMVATKVTNGGLSKPSILISSVNLRPLFGLPLNAVGNLLSFYFCVIEDVEMEFPALVGEIRQAKLRLKNLPKEKLSYESRMQQLGECLTELNDVSSFDVYLSTSLCGFPVKDVDFGWGKPISGSMLQSQTKDTMILLGSPGDGVEALVIFDEQKMAAFDKNENLLPFTSFNDSVKWKSKL
ncbi:hypothetical protein M9H77_05904 [Catharanthus roseus]|uniref:Uncharacterized protein n=1 Tax=Catharanthus roseus TaxID=4058 RepID=A0ACC0BQQ2_CATRO|nr:hypothetical protein M9H77_05904 [Catharanthus roseus]